MRKTWRDRFKLGTPERESFEDVDKLVVDATSVGAVEVNVEAVNIPITVQHTLRRVPSFFVLTESASAIILYSTAEDKANWTDKQIVLRSNTTGRCKVCVH